MPEQPQKSRTPNWAVHPGEILDEWMAERHVRAVELATSIGLQPDVVKQIQRCQAPVTSDIAERLATGTLITAATWLRLQSMYNDDQRRKELGSTAADESV